ncbi:MAG: hypothetical protein GX060_05760 [Firmicutes bacterium]|nr:hypothetical protein [Bacillota bacterium]
MRASSRFERKAICLGLLWGILSVGDWSGDNFLIRWLRFPVAVFSFLGSSWGWSAQSAYALAIIASTCLTYALARLLALLGRRLLYWRVGRVRRGGLR